MNPIVVAVMAIMAPTALGYVWIGTRSLLHSHERRRRPSPELPPLVRVTADLRRLHDLLEQTENAPSDLPAKHHRCVATRAAYLDVLTTACRHLEVPLPAGRPVPRTEIFRVESDLRRRGVDVRPVC